MNLSNIYNLPVPLYEAVKADPYSNGGADISCTRLINPVQLVALEKRHPDKIVPDVSERLWATYGQLMALLLERVVKGNPELAAKYRVEERVAAEVLGWKVSGQFDLFTLEGAVLSDWKFVGAYAAKMAKQGEKVEWEAQTNILRWLYWKATGTLAQRLEIVCLIRDYSEKIEREGLLPAETIEMPMWTIEATEQWITAKVQEHQQAANLPDHLLPPCSDTDRWLRNGRYVRCERYCPVRKICGQNNPSEPPF